MTQNPVSRQLQAEIGKGLDDAVEAMRWARRHYDDRSAAEIMRLVQHNLGILALAVDWRMEGEDLKAQEVLGRLWWSPHKRSQGPTDMNPTGH